VDFIVASNNKGKIREIKEMLKDSDFEVKSMSEAGIDADIPETGVTFEENATLKARYVSQRVRGAVVMADDSGLCVDALGGAPGVYSARYGGPGISGAARNQMLLDAIGDRVGEERTARFICVIAVIFPTGKSFTAQGVCEGKIALQAAGDNGFGYDPVFFLPQYNKTMAQLDIQLKNRISHRAKAVKLMRAKLMSR